MVFDGGRAPEAGLLSSPVIGPLDSGDQGEAYPVSAGPYAPVQDALLGEAEEGLHGGVARTPPKTPPPLLGLAPQRTTTPARPRTPKNHHPQKHTTHPHARTSNAEASWFCSMIRRSWVRLSWCECRFLRLLGGARSGPGAGGACSTSSTSPGRRFRRLH